MMNKTATRLLVLTLVLSLCLLSACGADKRDFSAVLDGDNAALDAGEHITVKRGTIKGMTMDDSAAWELDLPSDGYYVFEMEYTLGEEGMHRATLSLLNLDTMQRGDLACGYDPTGSWSKTDDTLVSITLPAGHYVINLIPDTGTDYERFIDLVEIRINGTFQKYTPPVHFDDTTEETQEEPQAYEGGWWVHPEDYDPRGISLLDIFTLEEGDDIAYSYDIMGQVVMEVPVTWEDDTVTMDLDLFTLTLNYNDQSMYDPETGEVFFVRSDDPGFREGENYDGVWYLDGDPASGTRYEITGKQIVWYGTDYSGKTSRESTWEYGPAVVCMPGSIRMDLTPSLKQEFPEPELYPILDGKAFLEEDMFDFNIFIREDALEEEGVLEGAQASQRLASHSWKGVAEDGQEMELQFYPDYFQISAVAGEDGSFISQPDVEGGTWKMTSAGTLSLTYSDATQEDVAYGETLVLEKIGVEFMSE